MMDSLMVIFSNISEQLFQGTPSDGCFLKVFYSTEAIIARKFQKSCSEKFEKFLKKQSVGVYIFLILANKNTTDGFLRICEMFQNSCFKERFRTAASENIWERCRTLNKNVGCRSSTLTERDLVNKIIHLLASVLKRAFLS